MIELTLHKAKKYGRNEWIEGWLILVDYRYAIMRDTLKCSDDGSSFLADVHSWDFVDGNTIHIVSPFLDDNDTRIYDGDIVASDDVRYEVSYDDGVFFVTGRVGGVTKKLLLFDLMRKSLDGVKVVGNKHDDFDAYMNILHQ